MKKILKLVVCLLGGLVAAFLAIGYGADPAFEQRDLVVVSAPVEKVWAVVGNPLRTREWLPADIADIDHTELKGAGIAEKAAGALLDKALGGGTNAGKDAPTHVYVLKNGEHLDLQTAEAKPNERYTERILGGNTIFSDFFASMTWGFEMKPHEGDRSKTDLVVLASGVSRKPVGNFVNFLGKKGGIPRQHAERFAANIEKAAAK